MTGISERTLPPPLYHRLWWYEFGACRGQGHLFFGPSDDGGVARDRTEMQRIAAAKKVCRDCPVKAACLEHAITLPEPFGVWGEMTQQERRLLVSRIKSRNARAKRRLAG